MNIKKTLISIIAESFKKPLEKINENTLFLKDLEADSLKMLELVFDIESDYKIKIDNNDLYDLKSVGELINLVENYLIKSS